MCALVAAGWNPAVVVYAKQVPVRIASANEHSEAARSGVTVDRSALRAFSFTAVTVQANAVNPRTSIARNLCVTVSASANAAYECGDLRVVHELPTVRLRNAPKTTTLLYNSQHAHPYPLVAANVQVTGTPAADTIIATLTVTKPGQAPTPVDTARYPGSPWTVYNNRRLVLGYDAVNDGTGIYKYTLSVQAKTNAGGIVAVGSDTGSFVIVNRRTGPYGIGWWLAGHEQLFPQADGALLWVGGDGSTRRFAAQGGGKYKVPVLDQVAHPESILVNGSGEYERYVKGGSKVVFNASGQHVRTLDRGWSTSALFQYTAQGSINQVWRSQGAGLILVHQLSYDPGTGRLQQVATRDGVGGLSRLTTLLPATGARVLSIRDPDQHVTSFGYTPDDLLTHRTDKRTTTTVFNYDVTQRLAGVSQPLTASQSAYTQFCPAEVRGFVASNCSAGSIEPFYASIVIDGPRSDVTDVTVILTDRFGAPEIIRNALNQQTRLQRSDVRFPGLVTAVETGLGTPSQFARVAIYDTMGDLRQQIDYDAYGPGQHAETRYEWHPRCAEPTPIVRPMGDYVLMGYDWYACVKTSQEDGRGVSSRVLFRYNVPQWANAARLLTSIVYPNSVVGRTDFDSLSYDAFGNLEHQYTFDSTGSVKTKRSATHVVNDAIGRVTSSCTEIIIGNPNQQCTTTRYDTMDLDSITTQGGPALNGAPAETLTVRQFYDEEGNLTKLERVSSPDPRNIATIKTEWEYDRAHRSTLETAPDGQPERKYYDRAGNTDSAPDDTLAQYAPRAANDCADPSRPRHHHDVRCG